MDKDLNILIEYCGRYNFKDIRKDDKLILNFINYSYEINIPIFFEMNNQIKYAFIPTNNHGYLLGPVLFDMPVFFNYQIENESLTLTKDWIELVPTVSFTDFTKDCLLIYNLYHDNMLNENDLIMHNCIEKNQDLNLQKSYSDLIFDYRENGKKHNPYDQEIRELTSIEHGDLDQLKRIIEEDYSG